MDSTVSSQAYWRATKHMDMLQFLGIGVMVGNEILENEEHEHASSWVGEWILMQIGLMQITGDNDCGIFTGIIPGR